MPSLLTRCRPAGFSSRFSFVDFVSRYSCLCQKPSQVVTSSPKTTAEAVIKDMGIEMGLNVQIGASKVFLRKGLTQILLQEPAFVPSPKFSFRRVRFFHLFQTCTSLSSLSDVYVSLISFRRVHFFNPFQTCTVLLSLSDVYVSFIPFRRVRFCQDGYRAIIEQVHNFTGLRGFIFRKGLCPSPFDGPTQMPVQGVSSGQENLFQSDCRGCEQRDTG